jgi:hypothetical protein
MPAPQEMSEHTNSVTTGRVTNGRVQFAAAYILAYDFKLSMHIALELIQTKLSQIIRR